jgi:serine/threonine protein kinase
MSSSSFAIPTAAVEGRTTQTDTAYRIQPQDPLPETDPPRIDHCLTKQEVLVVPYNTSTTEACKRTVDVVKSQNPQQAYVTIPSKEKKSLNHHAPGWGHVFFGVCLPIIAPGVFQEPPPESVEYVAIKRLCKAVVDKSLSQGKRENPYKEIQRMQALGDNLHVLGCKEALQDDKYLYIVMPYCEQESLVECIPWKQGLAEDQARKLFGQILENIVYLRAHGICHRDLSPDNCMIYKGRIVFTDLAMSFRIPRTTTLTSPMGGFGKPAYLPPEVFFNLPFDAHACDLWSAAVTLFNLLTGEILYRMPHPGDIMFRYFILARAISRTPVNERTVEVLMELEDAEQTSLWSVASKCMSLSHEVLDLLEGVLRMSMQDRWTSDDVANCPWMQYM